MYEEQNAIVQHTLYPCLFEREYLIFITNIHKSRNKFRTVSTVYFDLCLGITDAIKYFSVYLLAMCPVRMEISERNLYYLTEIQKSSDCRSLCPYLMNPALLIPSPFSHCWPMKKNSKNLIQGKKECITGWSLKIAVYKTFMGLTSSSYGLQILLTSAFYFLIDTENRYCKIRPKRRVKFFYKIFSCFQALEPFPVVDSANCCSRALSKKAQNSYREPRIP